MTPSQITHSDSIVHAITRESAAKYARGQKEHQGRLWEKGLLFHLDNAREEVVDLVAYTHDARVGVQKIKELVDEALKETTPDYTLRNILGEIRVLIEGVKA